MPDQDGGRPHLLAHIRSITCLPPLVRFGTRRSWAQAVLPTHPGGGESVLPPPGSIGTTTHPALLSLGKHARHALNAARTPARSTAPTTRSPPTGRSIAACRPTPALGTATAAESPAAASKRLERKLPAITLPSWIQTVVSAYTVFRARGQSCEVESAGLLAGVCHTHRRFAKDVN